MLKHGTNLLDSSNDLLVNISEYCDEMVVSFQFLAAVHRDVFVAASLLFGSVLQCVVAQR